MKSGGITAGWEESCCVCSLMRSGSPGPASSQPAEGGAVVTVTHVVTGPRSRLYRASMCTSFFQGAWFSCGLCIPSWLVRGPVWL